MINVQRVPSIFRALFWKRYLAYSKENTIEYDGVFFMGTAIVNAAYFNRPGTVSCPTRALPYYIRQPDVY